MLFFFVIDTKKAQEKRQQEKDQKTRLRNN